MTTHCTVSTGRVFDVHTVAGGTRQNSHSGFIVSIISGKATHIEVLLGTIGIRDFSELMDLQVQYFEAVHLRANTWTRSVLFWHPSNTVRNEISILRTSETVVEEQQQKKKNMMLPWSKIGLILFTIRQQSTVLPDQDLWEKLYDALACSWMREEPYVRRLVKINRLLSDSENTERVLSHESIQSSIVWMCKASQPSLLRYTQGIQ